MGDPVLQDTFRRKVDYLRISITDRCNERCPYCMPEGLRHQKPREEILTYEEILRVVRCAVELGFRSFRVTGGEPLVRKDAVDLLSRLGATPGLASLGLSTNGTLLAPVADTIRRAGVDSVNISLDTLDPRAYRDLTRGELADCLAGIEAAKRAGFPRIKLNTVLMRGVNEDQILPLIRFAREHGAILRLIELMPVTRTDLLSGHRFLSAEEVRSRLAKEMPLTPTAERRGRGPASYVRTPEGDLVGFIGVLSDAHFCETCNKMRLTADGKLRPCLGDHLEFDLRGPLRASGETGPVREVFLRALGLKPRGHQFGALYEPGRPMTAIGG